VSDRLCIRECLLPPPTLPWMVALVLEEEDVAVDAVVLVVRNDRDDDTRLLDADADDNWCWCCWDVALLPRARAEGEGDKDVTLLIISV
jgi:hypothetical protein